MNKRAFSFLELMIVLLIIGILAAVAFPQFRVARQIALTREAQANLKLIQAAEKIYGVEYTHYWTYANTSAINTGLRLDIPVSASPNWTYSVDAVTATNFRARAVPSAIAGTTTWCIQRTQLEPDATTSCNAP